MDFIDNMDLMADLNGNIIYDNSIYIPDDLNRTEYQNYGRRFNPKNSYNKMYVAILFVFWAWYLF